MKSPRTVLHALMTLAEPYFGLLVTSVLALGPYKASAEIFYPVGFSWERNLDWQARDAADSNTTNGNPASDTLGNPVWYYRWIDGGLALTSANPWHLLPSLPMIWSPSSLGVTTDGSWIRQAPALTPSASRHSLFLQSTTFQYTPEISWRNPTERNLSLRITGSIKIDWDSINPTQTPIDIAISLGTNASVNHALLTDTILMPSPGGTTVSTRVPVNLFANVGISEFIRITARMQIPSEEMRVSIQDGLTFTIVDDDLDGDGLSNVIEQQIGTSAITQDSDNDGWSDQCEDEFFGDPTDPNKTPNFLAYLTTNRSNNERSIRHSAAKSRSYFLEESGDLTGWTACGSAVSGSGDTVEIPIPSHPGTTRFFRVKSSRPTVDPVVESYRNDTGISESSGEAINTMLSELRSAGMNPDFLWIGGTRYNQPDQSRAVIGGIGEIVGAGNFTPFAETETSCRFNRGKFLQFNQPDVLRATAVENLAVAVWFEEIDYAQESNVLSTFDPLSKGILLQQLASGQTRLFTYASATAANPTAVFPIPTWSMKIRKRSQYYRIERVSPTSTIVHALLDSNAIGTNTPSVFNNHTKINIGGNSLTATATNTPWALSNCRINAVAISRTGPKPKSLDTYPGSPMNVVVADEMQKITEAPYTAGILQRQEFPLVLTLGDSTTATKWNTISFLTPPHAGAWMNNAAVEDYASGGSSMDFHVELTPYVEQLLRSQAYGPRYLIYTPEGLLNQAAISLGLPENDEVSWYHYTEAWLKGIEQRTNCMIVLSSYIKGNSSDQESGRLHRDRVREIALKNNWSYIPMWEDPHSQVWTGAVPGSYGFYYDMIHQSELGRKVQAEIFAAAVPHLTDTSSPRADLNNPPQVYGYHSIGSALSCTTGNFFHLPTDYSYQWLRNLEVIPGATSSTYLVQPGDQGARLACRVVANKQGCRSTSFTSAPTSEISP